MTAMELIVKLNDEFGIGEWPAQYKVDADTYGHCCHYVFRQVEYHFIWLGHWKRIALGKNDGLMFKNIELIMEP